MENNLDVHLTKDKEIELFSNIEIPSISSRVKPDLSVYSKKKKQYVFFTEVESETFEGTVKKMYFILMLQLIKAKCCVPAITDITGLVLPKLLNKKGCILAITVAWDISSFRFIPTITPIRRSRVQMETMKIINNQDVLLPTALSSTEKKIYFQDFLSNLKIQTYLASILGPSVMYSFLPRNFL